MKAKSVFSSLTVTTLILYSSAYFFCKWALKATAIVPNTMQQPLQLERPAFSPVFISEREMNRMRTCDKKIDLLLVLDGSVSIGYTNWVNVIRPFAVSMIEAFSIGPDDTRVGIVVFSYSVEVEFDFTSSLSTDAAAAITRINSLSHPASSTNTPGALETAYNILSTQSRDNAIKVMVIVTDDAPTTLDTFAVSLDYTLANATRLNTLPNYFGFFVGINIASSDSSIIQISRAVADCSLTDISDCQHIVFSDFGDVAAQVSDLAASVCSTSVTTPAPATTTSVPATTTSVPATTTSIPATNASISATTTTIPATTNATAASPGVIAGAVTGSVALAGIGGAGAYYFSSSSAPSVASTLQEVKETFKLSVEGLDVQDASLEEVEQVINADDIMFESVDLE